jgi:hypothetical protein
VVAEREHVGPGREQPLGEARGDAGAVGDVLRVDDAEADLELLLQRRQALLDRRPPRRAEDVRDEEDLQDRTYGNESAAAAGCTDIATWLPAFCV